jgi:hypothetical protein
MGLFQRMSLRDSRSGANLLGWHAAVGVGHGKPAAHWICSRLASSIVRCITLGLAA